MTAATSAANCGQNVVNAATIAGDGDRVASNNSDNGDVTVLCGALRILKQSTKPNNPLVSNAGAVFTVTGLGTVRDNNNPTGDLTDASTTIGEVCVEDVAPGSYTVNETTPPPGYGDAGQSNLTAVVTAGENCSSNKLSNANSAIFTNPPLVDIQVRFRDGGSGETVLDTPGIQCDNTTGDSSTAGTLGWDDTLTVTGIKLTSPTITITCTIPIDP